MNRWFFPLLFAALLATRLCHSGVLWTEEDLPLAAAIQLLHGKALYRDIWFDKPPLVSGIYLLWGAQIGWMLRLAGTLYALAACWIAWRFGRDLWSEQEGRLAAALLAFFLIFDLPASVVPLAADSLMLVPHLAAVWLAWRNRPLWSGALAGAAFLFNTKALFVLAACALFQYRALPPLALGFLLPNAAALGWLALRGSLRDYYEQVWWLGFLYARSTFVEHPLAEGLLRTANWMGFHAALALGAAALWWREHKPVNWKLAGWALLSLAAVTAGWRFFPRYYVQLLPVAVLAAARGIALIDRRAAAVALLALAVPLVRFGPRYAMLAGDLLWKRPHRWSDVGMDDDSRAAARLLLARARPGDTLFVWGYRPDLYVYTRLPAVTRFLESQPLSGVFADRHLFQTASVAPDWARRNREELTRARPTFVVDGLARYNPALSIGSYPDLRAWLANYRVTAQTPATLIYERTSPETAWFDSSPVSRRER